MTIGERIKKTREEQGISQTELALSAKISKQSMYKYENNIITNIPSDKIELIARRLGVEPAYLMGWKVLPEEQKVSNNEDTNERIKLLARHIDDFPEKQRNRILSNFEDTLEMYIEEMGIEDTED